MLSKISGLSHTWARGGLILAIFAVFMAFVAISLPALQAAPGGDIESLDARFFYTPQVAYEVIGSYGEARRFWAWIYLTWDIINPILYTLTLSLFISWLTQRSFAPRSSLQMLNLIPLGGGLSDLFENISIVILLFAYPAQPTVVAWSSTIFTMSKMSFLVASALLIILGIVRASMNRFKVQ